MSELGERNRGAEEGEHEEVPGSCNTRTDKDLGEWSEVNHHTVGCVCDANEVCMLWHVMRVVCVYAEGCDVCGAVCV